MLKSSRVALGGREAAIVLDSLAIKRPIALAHLHI